MIGRGVDDLEPAAGEPAATKPGESTMVRGDGAREALWPAMMGIVGGSSEVSYLCGEASGSRLVGRQAPS